MTQVLMQEQEQQTGMIWDYVSPSRLNLWLKCPLAFRKKYIDEEPSITSPALFVGKVVHSVLAHVYRKRIAGHLYEIEELPMIVADTWNMSMELDPCFFCNDAEEEQVLDLATVYLETIPIQEERPVAIEKRYEVPLVTPQGEYLGIPLVGIVDLIIEMSLGGGYTMDEYADDFRKAIQKLTQNVGSELNFRVCLKMYYLEHDANYEAEFERQELAG